jgi:hypothetical protein
MIFRLKETAFSGAGLCFGDNWRAFLVEMKSSGYGNLDAKAFLSVLVVVSREFIGMLHASTKHSPAPEEASATASNIPDLSDLGPAIQKAIFQTITGKWLLTLYIIFYLRAFS